MSLRELLSRRPLSGGLPRPDRRGAGRRWELCEPRVLLAVSINDISVTEPVSGTTNAVFTVSVDPSNAQTVTIDYRTADGTARAGTDYQGVSGTLTFAPGKTSQTLSVPILGGQPAKPNDTFTVVLSNPTNDVIDPDAAAGTGTILAAPGLSINDVTAFRVASGPNSAVFTVTLNPPNIEQTVTVHYATADGTAKAGVDYQPTSGTLTFTPDQTSQMISVPIIPGTSVQPNETFTVSLTDPVNAVINRGTGTATIVDLNKAGTLQFGSSTFSVAEDAGAATITVTRTDGNASGVSVSYATSGGTATPGVDYTPVSGTLNFAAGQTSQTFTVPVASNLLLGANKTVGLVLSNPTGGGSLGPQSTATLTIINPNTLVVSNTNDSGPGSLRQAMLTSNANPGSNHITFAIPGAGPFTIIPTSELPEVAVPVDIDATSQPGYQGTPLVSVDGERAGDQVDGFTLTVGNSTVRGLAINRFGGSGILIQQGGGNRVVANVIGTNAAGDAALGNGFDGVSIESSSNNTIGGTAAGSGNLLSGNGIVGVQVTGTASTGNVVQGNLIGTDRSGKKALGNQKGGVFFDKVSGNTVGGSDAGARNVISGNLGAGVQIAGPSASANVVRGNLIGTDISGGSPLGNTSDGVYIQDASANTIGGAGANQGNVISGNQLTGVRIAGQLASGNLVQGNRIGTDLSGTRAVANVTDGVFVNGASKNTIGGTAAGAGNVISGNGSVGLQIFGSSASANLVQGNLIGTDASGLEALGNGRDGVYINAAPDNTIGGTASGARNVISANRLVGLQFSRRGATGNVVQGNLIGPDINGQPVLGNGVGLFLDGAVGNTIGGPGAAQNVIEGNLRANRLNRGRISPDQAAQAGPSITDVTQVGTSTQVNGLVLSFSGPLDASRAQNIRNYRLRVPGTGGSFNSPDAVAIPLSSATYDASSNQVTLTFVTPLNSQVPFQLRVNGRPPRGLTDTDGRYLSGAGNGKPGDYVQDFGPSASGTGSSG